MKKKREKTRKSAVRSKTSIAIKLHFTNHVQGGAGPNLAHPVASSTGYKVP